MKLKMIFLTGITRLLCSPMRMVSHTRGTGQCEMHAWHQYAILLDGSIDRDEFFTYMRSANIGVNLHYIPVYRHSYYIKNFGFDAREFPVTEDVFGRIITLPMFPRMSEQQVEYVVTSILQAIEHLKK